MLDWETLRICHQKVPVRCWPVLWFYLACLRLTLNKAWAEGRDGVVWSLQPDGVIYIKHWGESTAERARRGGLPLGFDRTPWTRLETGFDARLLARIEGELARDMSLAALMASVMDGAYASALLAMQSSAASPAAPLFHPP